MDDLKSQDLESQDWERLDWESLFSPRILVRGMGYYESGAVTELSRTEGGYRALVEGTEDYEVEIEIKDNRILDMRCTCLCEGTGNTASIWPRFIRGRRRGRSGNVPWGL